jgi:hypothetical protein
MTVLISRADAIEAVLTYFVPRSHTGERGEHEEDFVRTIFNALPSSNAEEVVLHKILQKGMIEIPSADAKQGERIDNGIPDSILSKCSNCGYTAGAFSFNFCPNCGARMK